MQGRLQHGQASIGVRVSNGCTAKALEFQANGAKQNRAGRPVALLVGASDQQCARSIVRPDAD